MAVYQISRIQVRRGQKHQGTGIPQLASGEMAWAVDTQELYIGNGAVSEGAPGVGNTRLLTLNDLSAQGNLLELSQYSYAVTLDIPIATGPSASSPVYRTLQTRLDDQVSTSYFGTTTTFLFFLSSPYCPTKKHSLQIRATPSLFPAFLKKLSNEAILLSSVV